MYDQSEEKPKIDCSGSWKLYKSGAKLRAKKQGGVTPIDSILHSKNESMYIIPKVCSL